MNPYLMVGSGNGTFEAAALSDRLATWHDAMVAHERKIRAGRAGDVCDEECPHAEAHTLWVEALEVFGDRAQELTFLRSRAIAEPEPSEGPVASSDILSEDAGRPGGTNGSGHWAPARRSQVFLESAERYRTARAEER